MDRDAQELYGSYGSAIVGPVAGRVYNLISRECYHMSVDPLDIYNQRYTDAPPQGMASTFYKLVQLAWNADEVYYTKRNLGDIKPVGKSINGRYDLFATSLHLPEGYVESHGSRAGGGDGAVEDAAYVAPGIILEIAINCGLVVPSASWCIEQGLFKWADTQRRRAFVIPDSKWACLLAPFITMVPGSTIVTRDIAGLGERTVRSYKQNKKAQQSAILAIKDCAMLREIESEDYWTAAALGHYRLRQCEFISTKGGLVYGS